MESRFQFGENWLQYSDQVSDVQLKNAELGITKLIDVSSIQGASVLDIGSGSGVHAKAFLRLGSKHVTAIDFDEKSVIATKSQLASEDPDKYNVFRADILNMQSIPSNTFDIVYSWGVLHHTGNLKFAIRNAASLVSPGGLLVVAIYQRTRFCGFWRVEKRFYSHSPKFAQKLIRTFYVVALRFALRKIGNTTLRELRKHYSLSRGMLFDTDLHDWLGGFPYESMSPNDYESIIGQEFVIERKFVLPKSNGLLGTGCFEFVHRRERI